MRTLTLLPQGQAPDDLIDEACIRFIGEETLGLRGGTAIVQAAVTVRSDKNVPAQEDNVFVGKYAS